jgi:hypothetical protein
MPAEVRDDGVARAARAPTAGGAEEQLMAFLNSLGEPPKPGAQ